MSEAGGSMVLRSRLLDRLAQRHHRSATMIVAGAGFGKTTLLRQLLDDPGRAPDVVDVAVPLRSPALDAAALPAVLASAVTGTTMHDVDLDDLVDMIWSRSPVQVALVVDDTHLLDGDACDVLARLHGRLPHNGHLVLAGRRAPFEVSQRDLVTGAVDVIGEHDLAFDDDELSAFDRVRGAATRCGSDAPTRWPALLELELASGRSGAVRYLVEELLDHLAPDDLAVLRRLALHHSVDEQLIDAVVGPDGGHRLSVADVGALLPMTTTYDDHDVVVVHDLVREALVSGLSDDERREALGRIAEVLDARGDDEAAVRLHTEVGDHDAIEQIARRLVVDLHMRDGTDANRRLLDAMRVPLGSSLVLDTLDGVLTLLDHPDRARTMLDAAAARARAVGDDALETLAVLRLADDAYCAADHDALALHRARLHELAASGSTSAQRLAVAADVWHLSLAGRHGDIVGFVDDVVARTDPDPELADFLEFNRVIHRAYAGHITDALERAQSIRQLPDSLYANRLAGFELVQRWQLGILTADERAAAVRLVDRIEAMGQVALFVEGAATTALFHASVGDVATAASLVERAERVADRLPTTAWPVHTVAQCRAVLHVVAGDEEAAIMRLRAALPPQGVGGLPRFVYGATAALSYVLLPETRPVWDADPCGPDHEVRLQVARALVAVRDRGDTALAAALPWDDVTRLQPWAYEPHLVELAVAAIDAGVGTAAAAIDGLRHDPHQSLAALAAGDGPLARRAGTVAKTAPRRPRAALRAAVMGPMTLERCGSVVDDDVWTRRRRVRDLFGLLVHHRRVDRAKVAAAMWPDKSTESAAGNLRYTLNQLLSVLEPDRPASAPSWFVRSFGQQLELVTDELLTIDVDALRADLAAAQLEDRSGSPARALERYRRALERYRGPYLVDVSDDGWGYWERMNLQGALAEAASRAVDLLVAAGELDEAERLAATGVELEPLNERSTRALTRVLLERRRIGAAREVIAQLLDELSEMGIEPEPTTRDLADRLGVATDC